MKSFGFSWLLGIMYLGLLALFFVDWGEMDIFIQKAVYLIAPITALLAGGLTLRRIGWVGKRSVILKYLLVALGLWFLGEVTTLYMAWKEEEFYPSMVDVFFLIGYAVFSVAVIMEAKLFNLHWRKLNPLVLAVLGILYGLVVGVVGYIGIVMGYRPEETLLVNLTTISWSIGDLVIGGLGVVLLAMVWEYREGAVKRAWFWFLGAFIVNLVADTVYNLNPTAAIDGSITMLVLDAIWISGYFLFAGYFLEIMKSINRLQQKIAR